MMMRVVALLALILLPLPALAQVVRVTGGDHPDFTRIVIEYAGPVNWVVGRTRDGYELRLPDGGAQYDLSAVFDQIGKERLAAIWADPDSGALHFGVACACFAMPFEFRPGTVVVDIRNGPAPKGSSFEEPIDGGVAPDLAARPVIRPVGRPRIAEESRPDGPPQPALQPHPAGPVQVYDWTKGLTEAPADRSALDSAALGLNPDPPGETGNDLEPLRQSLIEQLSRGASEGIVDMAKPKSSVEIVADDGTAAVEIRLGEAPNLVIRQKGEAEAPLSAAGAECLPDERLDVAAWAEQGPVAEQFGPALSGLTGEFDRPDPEAVKKATRFYLNLGFGAEARAILRAFPTEQEDAAIWQNMARILDDEADPNPVFAGMAACDTKAALWAILADPGVLSVGQVEKAAILRAFSALPIHMRQQLGPTMVDRFLAMKDFATATALRDAVLRGTAEPGPEIELMEAAIETASGSPGASQARLEALTAQSSPTTPDALAALIIQRAEHGQDVSFQQVQAMEGYAKEREGSEDHDKFQLALTLAYGASGDFEKAFAQLPDTPDAAAVLWQVLAFAGKNSALLDHATLAEGAAPPREARGAATVIAQRMVTLGLADQAAQWLGLAADPPRLLAARVALGQGDPERALALLEGEVAPTADKLRIDAWHQLGDESAIAALYAAREMPVEEMSAISRMRDWQRLASDGPEVWKAATAVLLGPQATAAEGATADPTEPTPPVGPLERDQVLIDQSAATRAAIEALLAAVKSPEALTQ